MIGGAKKAATHESAGIEATDVALLRSLDAQLRRFIGGAVDRADLAASDRAEIENLRSLARHATDAGIASWEEHRQRVDRSWKTDAPEAVRSLAHEIERFLGLSEETAALGSAHVPVIRFADVRGVIAAHGEKVLGQIAQCIALAIDREERDRAWHRARVSFVAELYARDETRELMRAFDRLESLHGAKFEEIVRPALIRALAVTVARCAANGQPFAYRDLPLDSQVPLYDFRAMREEWREQRGSNAREARLSA